MLLIQLLALGIDVISPEDVKMPKKGSWTKIVSCAINHGVICILADALEKMPVGTIKNRHAIMYIYGSSSQQEQTYDRKLDTLRKITDAWHEAGLRISVLKGMAYERYYPCPKHRISSDMDCYLSDFDLGNKIAAEQGATVDTSEQKHSHIRLDKVEIENHRDCCGQLADKTVDALNDYLISLLEGESAGTIADTYYEYPPLMFDALFYMYHARSHFIIEEGLQLRHVLDWVLIRREICRDITVRDEFVALCEKYGLMKFYVAMDGVASYVDGTLKYEDMTEAQQLMLSDILSFRENKAHVTKKKSRFMQHVDMLKEMWHNRWKYPIYSDTTALGMMYVYVKGYVGRLWRM